MYFWGVPVQDHVAITPPPPVVGVRTSVPLVAGPSFASVDNVTVTTPAAPTSVLATYWVAALVEEQPASLVVVGRLAFDA